MSPDEKLARPRLGRNRPFKDFDLGSPDWPAAASFVRYARDTCREFARLFSGNPAAHYVRTDQGYEAVDRGIAVNDVLQHLAGRRPLLSIPIDAGGMSRWGAIDLDRHGEGEPPVDHVALARLVTERGLTLVVCQSRGGAGAWLFLFVKEPDGIAASAMRSLLKHYIKALGLTGEIEIFPKQSKLDAGQMGNGINLPYAGGERVAFGPGGEELTLDGFLDLARERAAFGSLLERGLPDDPGPAPRGQPSEKTKVVTPRQARQAIASGFAELLHRLPQEGQERDNALTKLSLLVGNYVKAGALPEKVAEQDLVFAGHLLDMDPRKVGEMVPRLLREGQEKSAVQLADWRRTFRTVKQLEAGPLKMCIEGILPEGITAIGALAGVGKTWFALAMARALATGEKFLGVYGVPERCNVLYLSPEVGDRALRQRLEKLGVPDERFYCRTMRDGAFPLDDPHLEAAVAELQPVVFLDTLVRFNPTEDENAARQNAALLASALFRIVGWGARAMAFLHHSPKAQSEADFMTLENVLRGTGDIGAMCDAVWGLQHDRRRLKGKPDLAYLDESRRLTRLHACCVKPRDFEPAAPFRVQGRPYIDQKGDLAVILAETRDEKVDRLLAADPGLSLNELARQLGNANKGQVKDAAAAMGWHQGEDGWVRDELPDKLPF